MTEINVTSHSRAWLGVLWRWRRLRAMRWPTPRRAWPIRAAAIR